MAKTVRFTLQKALAKANMRRAEAGEPVNPEQLQSLSALALALVPVAVLEKTR